MSTVLHGEVIPKETPKAPSLKPVFFLNLKLEEPDTIFTKKDRNHTASLVKVKAGEITPVKNDYGLELKVKHIHGYDDLTAYLENGVTELDCKLYGKTPNGSGVYISYGGVVKFSNHTLKVLGRQESHSEFKESYITCFPKFSFDDGIEDEYKWIDTEAFVGEGRFVRDSEGSLYVQYYVSVLR